MVHENLVKEHKMRKSCLSLEQGIEGGPGATIPLRPRPCRTAREVWILVIIQGYVTASSGTQARG